MPSDVRILTARRAYEFKPDHLRLTMISVPEIADRIKGAFSFTQAAIGTPMQTFGPVPVTFPPGIVFDIGAHRLPDRTVVPIRFLHFEPARIVIDVAGPSSAIDSIFDKLRDVLSSVSAPDGSSVIGESPTSLDYSEVAAHLSFRADKLLPWQLHLPFFGPGYYDLADFDDYVPPLLHPTIYLRSIEQHATVTGLASLNDHRAVRLEPQVGTRMDDQMYSSAGPFDTDGHRAFLVELEDVLTAR